MTLSGTILIPGDLNDCALDAPVTRRFSASRRRSWRLLCSAAEGISEHRLTDKETRLDTVAGECRMRNQSHFVEKSTNITDICSGDNLKEDRAGRRAAQASNVPYGTSTVAKPMKFHRTFVSH
ncbi:hypothetical protein KM043_017172 [Ampulex compressa]|nr:hypothetical protein KM043_017172 [Ampulex compressa]